jgi:hypothetical protein
MPAIVLVHGIAQEQHSADWLESQWLPALAGGVRNAGFPQVADRIWRDQSGPGAIEARMAFYGHLFLRPGVQGVGAEELSPEQSAIAEGLAEEWLGRAASRASREAERRTAEAELAFIRPGPGREPQGVGAVARSAIRSAARLRWFGLLGMAFAERFVWQALAQVTRYLTDDAVRAAAQEAVLDLIGPDTKVVVSHSLGTVVAYEAVTRLERPLPLLVTLGSPLGLDRIIYPRLRPRPPTFPLQVRRWVNVADTDDFVAAEPDLTALFSAAIPEGATFEGGYTVDNGAQPHSSTFYLGKVQVGRPIGQVLADHP